MKLKLFSLMLLSLIITVNNSFSADTKNDTLTSKKAEIIITGTRYPESLIEVPMATSVVEKSQMENIKGYGLNEALNFVPGVLAQSRYGNQDVRISIRGFGVRGAGDRSNSGVSRGIKFYIDGIPETEPDGRSSLDNFDLSFAERIEIVRSNSSALWGNGAGGVINLISVPKEDKSFLNLEGLGGSYGFQKYVLNAGSINGQNKLYGSLIWTKNDGWRANSQSERKILNFGINSALAPTTQFNLHVSGVDNLFYIPGPLTQDEFNNTPEIANTKYAANFERRHNRTARIGLTIDHYFDAANSIHVMSFINPKYLQRSERGTFRDFTRYHLGGGFNYQNRSDLSEEVKNTVIAGFDEAFQDGAILFYNLTPEGWRGDNLQSNKSEGANSFGAFVQDEISFNNKLSFLLGLRYDNMTYHAQEFESIDYSEVKSFEGITPKIGVTYRFTPEHSMYFNYGGGIEVPVGNETDPPSIIQGVLINPLLDPIKSQTIELGTKQFIDGNSSFIKGLEYDVAVYYITTNNDIIPYREGRFYTTAAETERIGIEFGLSGAFDHGITLRGAFTFASNKYKNYRVDSVYIDTLHAGKYADFSENKMAGLPETHYSVSLRYEPDFFSYIFAECSLIGVGEYYVDDANKITVPSYNIINLSLGMSKPAVVTKGLTCRVFIAINNLMDTKYAGSAYVNPDINSVTKLPMFLEPGLPRNFVAGLQLGM